MSTEKSLPTDTVATGPQSLTSGKLFHEVSQHLLNAVWTLETMLSESEREPEDEQDTWDEIRFEAKSIRGNLWFVVGLEDRTAEGVLHAIKLNPDSVVQQISKDHRKAAELLQSFEDRLPAVSLYKVALQYAVSELKNAYCKLMVVRSIEQQDRPERQWPPHDPDAPGQQTTVDQLGSTELLVPFVLMDGHGFTTWSDMPMSAFEAECLAESLSYHDFDCYVVNLRVRLPDAKAVLRSFYDPSYATAEPIEVKLTGPISPVGQLEKQVAEAKATLQPAEGGAQ